MVAEIKVVVAYVATGSPADAAEQGHAGCAQQDLAVGTAGADAPHPLGQVATTTATGGTMPAGQVLPATPSLATLEDTSQSLAPEKALRFVLCVCLCVLYLSKRHIQVLNQV